LASKGISGSSRHLNSNSCCTSPSAQHTLLEPASHTKGTQPTEILRHPALTRLLLLLSYIPHTLLPLLRQLLTY
jgi:hypothetical protein